MKHTLQTLCLPYHFLLCLQMPRPSHPPLYLRSSLSGPCLSDLSQCGPLADLMLGLPWFYKHIPLSGPLRQPGSSSVFSPFLLPDPGLPGHCTPGAATSEVLARAPSSLSSRQSRTFPRPPGPGPARGLGEDSACFPGAGLLGVSV